MKQNLVIVGTGMYGLLAKEIAESLGAFEKIAFVDDGQKPSSPDFPLLGTSEDLATISEEYPFALVAIGNPNVRKKLVEKIESIPTLTLATLISPAAYVSPSAQIGPGCVIEPGAVVQTKAVIEKGTFLCAGAVVNHAAVIEPFVQVDCNATVPGYVLVPEGYKVPCGTVFQESSNF